MSLLFLQKHVTHGFSRTQVKAETLAELNA